MCSTMPCDAGRSSSSRPRRRHERAMQQDELFTTTSLLPGFLHEPEFIDRAEEAELVRLIRSLPLEEARYREFTARRRIVSFGASYDFSSRELRVAGAIPAVLH